jgi:hypothetical protein
MQATQEKILEYLTLSLARGDRSLQEELAWAIDRLDKAGYPVSSKVRLLVDPNLDIMGYATEEEGIQHIVVAEWALQSEMLGGLLFHELAHIYHAERHSHSHEFKITNAIIAEFSQREGLNEREIGYLVEGFNHLQNIIVDDIVFDVMDDVEKARAKVFFQGWLTDKPSGYPLVDAAALARNAFAIASLKRRGLFDERDPGDRALTARSVKLAKGLGRDSHEKYALIEKFLVEADPDWEKKTFRNKLGEYLDFLVELLLEEGQMDDLK